MAMDRLPERHTKTPLRGKPLELDMLANQSFGLVAMETNRQQLGRGQQPQPRHPGWDSPGGEGLGTALSPPDTEAPVCPPTFETPRIW